MKNLFGKAVFGFLLASLCSVAACMTEVDRSTATDGTEATASVPAQSPSSQSPSENPPGHVGADPADATSASLDADPKVSACVAMCDGDEGCILCCHCTHPDQCCF